MDGFASELEFATAFGPEAFTEVGTTFVTTLEEQIEHSKSHWSELAEPIELLSREEAAAIKLDNEEVFMVWKSHPEWGFFFWTMDDFEELKVGKKFAEGTQAELFDVHVRWRRASDNQMDVEEGRKWVVKVFKEGTKVRDLQHQWPHGMFQFRALLIERGELGKDLGNKYRSFVNSATLLGDGRFAFLMGKEDGDLRSLIDHKMLESGHGGGGPFSKVEAQAYMCDVALGVDELHRFNIVHRDIKASNVLVFKDVKGDTYCYVSDYECSIGVVGTGWWRAPEILRACKDKNVKKKPELFSRRADIYALGMTFYEILTGKYPFRGEEVTIDRVIEGQRPYVPEFVDEWARQLLYWCWKCNRGTRPSIKDILGILEANSCSEYIRGCLAERREFFGEDGTLATNDDGPTSN